MPWTEIKLNFLLVQDCATVLDFFTESIDIEMNWELVPVPVGATDSTVPVLASDKLEFMEAVYSQLALYVNMSPQFVFHAYAHGHVIGRIHDEDYLAIIRHFSPKDALFVPNRHYA